MRIVHGEEDRWESRDHAYSQGLIDGAEQASSRSQDAGVAGSPPQVTVNPPGPAVRGGSLALLVLLVLAGLAALFFSHQGGSDRPHEGPQQNIEQHFGQDPTGGPTPDPSPPGVPEPEPDSPGVDAPAASVQEPAGEPGAGDAGVGSGPGVEASSDAPVDPVQAPTARPAPEPVNPAPAPPVAADPQPQPAPEPTPTPTPRPGLVTGLVGVLDETVDGTLGLVDGLVCGLLCP